MVSAKNASSDPSAHKPNMGESNKGYIDTSEFVDAIIWHSRGQEGRNYKELAEYLRPTLRQRQDSQLSREDKKEHLQGYMQIYNPQNRFVLRKTLESVEQIWAELQIAQDVGGTALLILLRDLPSPSLLAGLGSVCHLEPEFLRRHLANRWEEHSQSLYGEVNNQSTASLPLLSSLDLTLPSLPSTSSNMIQLRYTSLGHDIHNGARVLLEQSYSSVVQEVSSIGGDYFAVEQQISICVEHFPTKHGGNDSWLGEWMVS